MAEKELRRMSRPELIEIIYALKSNEESLQKKTLMAAIGQKQAGAEDNILPAADSDFRGRLYCRGCPSVERYIFYCPGRSR